VHRDAGGQSTSKLSAAQHHPAPQSTRSQEVRGDIDPDPYQAGNLAGTGVFAICGPL
jgi:hypothetical protein